MRPTLAGERARLHARLAELDRERGQIAFALSVLDRLGADDTASSGSARATTRVSGPNLAPRGRQQPEMRSGGSVEHAIRAITESHRTWRAEDLLPVMRANGWAAEVADELQTVRTALARATKAGLIVRVGPGTYANPGTQASQDLPAASVDADAGASTLDGVDEDDPRGSGDEGQAEPSPLPAMTRFADLS